MVLSRSERLAKAHGRDSVKVRPTHPRLYFKEFRRTSVPWISRRMLCWTLAAESGMEYEIYQASSNFKSSALREHQDHVIISLPRSRTCRSTAGRSWQLSLAERTLKRCSWREQAFQPQRKHPPQPQADARAVRGANCTAEAAPHCSLIEQTSDLKLRFMLSMV